MQNNPVGQPLKSKFTNNDEELNQNLLGAAAGAGTAEDEDDDKNLFLSDQTAGITEI